MVPQGHPLKTPPPPGSSSLMAAADVITQPAQAILRTDDASCGLMAASPPFRVAAPLRAQERR